MKHLSEVNESHSDSADSVRAAAAGLAHKLFCFFCFVLFERKIDSCSFVVEVSFLGRKCKSARLHTGEGGGGSPIGC